MVGHRILLSLIPKNRLGDRIYSFLFFVIRHKRKPGKTFLHNDVQYRIKTTDEILNPLRVFVSDKEFVKTYVKAIVGDQYNVPTIYVLRSIEEVDSYEFPDDCCIKPTQASGRAILRRNGEPISLEEIKSWFSINHYEFRREANYKSLKPKVIIEPLLFNDSNIMDYKMFCYNGEPKLIQVDIDRYINHTRKILDSNWNELDFSIMYERSEKHLERPDNFDEMLKVASALSEGFSLVRVDLYSDGNECLVGEITNCSDGAGGAFIPKAAERVASQILYNQPIL